MDLSIRKGERCCIFPTEWYIFRPCHEDNWRSFVSSIRLWYGTSDIHKKLCTQLAGFPSLGQTLTTETVTLFDFGGQFFYVDFPGFTQLMSRVGVNDQGATTYIFQVLETLTLTTNGVESVTLTDYWDGVSFIYLSRIFTHSFCDKALSWKTPLTKCTPYQWHPL